MSHVSLYLNSMKSVERLEVMGARTFFLEKGFRIHLIAIRLIGRITSLRRQVG